MAMQKINGSSNVEAFGYDRRAEQLYVTFKSMVTYRYDDVPQHVYDGFLQASSKGRFFRAEVLDQYATTNLGKDFAFPERKPGIFEVFSRMDVTADPAWSW